LKQWRLKSQATVVKRVKTHDFLSVHTVKTCEMKQNTYRHSKTKQFFQTASTLTAYQIREKTIQLTISRGTFGRRTGRGSSRKAMKNLLLGTKEAPITQIR
jgi:hypothetical protein